MDVYELLSVGMIILLGLLGGKLSHRIKIPKVTGYMIIGLIFGPSVLNFITSSTLNDIHMINDIALGMILFAIGGEIEINHLRSLRKKLLYITLAESFGAFALVSFTTWLFTQDLFLALILGSIAIATAPGVTLLVIREYEARGPLTDILLAVVALNNVLCLVVFRVFLGIYSVTESEPVINAVIGLIKDFGGSILIGAAIAGLITYWEQKIDDLSELLLVIIGGVLLGIGLARTFGVSPLAVCLIIGAITNNLSMMHRLVYAELRQIEMPFYIAFFVLSGASLHLGSLSHLGVLGIVYLLARPTGKYLGTVLVAKKSGADETITRNIGMALLPQAGVAIGMVLTISESYPEMGQMIGVVVYSSVIVYEGVGPFFTRMALSRAGEVRLQE